MAVQSLHTIPGAEFHDLVKELAPYEPSGAKALNQLVIGTPLLASYEDVERVATLMLKQVPKDRTRQDAVIFMGHGSGHHPADMLYMATAEIFRRNDPLAFLGTVEGHPTFDDVVAQCQAAKIKKAYLMPFMAVAGDHALNDMAGSEPDSWKSVLESKKIECIPVLKGTADYEEIVQIWLDHLQQAINSSGHDGKHKK